jgi:signal peptidase I
MFGPFASVDQKTRASANNWLELAVKVWNYRRDVLAPPLLRELEAKMSALRALLAERAEASRIKPGIEALEEVLRRAGGTHYPRTETVEWVEFLLVAAIVIIGVRTYFIQPFQIPTNSMWPSYHGMTADIYAAPDREPSQGMEAVRFALTGARPRRIDAPVAGEVLIPLVNERGRVRKILPNGQTAEVPARGNVDYTGVPDHSWLVIPTEVNEYRLLVGDRMVSLRVPEDFDFDWVVRDTFFPTTTKETVQETLAREIQRPGATVDMVVDDGHGGNERVRFLRTGRNVQAGDRVLSFDILAGDMLMVDRFSYHFVRPSVGSGFVFRTGAIAKINVPDENGVIPPETFYIKRLVGTPGDTLQVREPVLYRNGAPITGAPSFDKEARRSDRYPGYRALHDLANSQTVTVPPGDYFAMGDNSPNSYDSRFWGFVPAASVIGRPLLIYYPFPRINLSQ